MGVLKMLLALGVVALLGYGMVAHHLFAPSDPYGPCPAGSHYIATWFPGDKWPQDPAGVIHWFGSTELATCGAGITMSVG